MSGVRYEGRCFFALVSANIDMFIFVAFGLSCENVSFAFFSLVLANIDIDFAKCHWSNEILTSILAKLHWSNEILTSVLGIHCF